MLLTQEKAFIRGTNKVQATGIQKKILTILQAVDACLNNV